MGQTGPASGDQGGVPLPVRTRRAWRSRTAAGLAVLALLGIAAPAAALTFSPAPTTGSAGVSTPSSIASGDFNGDGRLDLAGTVTGDPVSGPLSPSVAVLLGDGAGGLAGAPGSPLATGQRFLSHLAVGDFTGDRRLDVAAAGPAVSLLLGDGTGRLTNAPGSPFASGGLQVSDLAAGDFNADRRADVATANLDVSGLRRNSVSVLLGDGSGRLSPAPGSPAVGAAHALVGRSVAAGDFNADGRLDAASGNAVLLGDGSGRLTSVSGSPFGSPPPYSPSTRALGADVAVGDFNADARPDIATTYRETDSSCGELAVFMGRGSGRFAAAHGSPFTPICDPASIAAGDFNGDGHLDLAMANGGTGGTPASFSVLLGDGSGFFMASSGGAISQRPSQTSLTAGDFNADGRLDVATSTPDPGGAEVWINGRGAAQPALTLTGVSLQRSCLSARRTVVQGTNRKLTIRYTLNDAARLSVTVKRQVRPRASAPTRCLSGRSARRGVKFAKVGSFRVRGARGGKSVTLDTNGALKAPGESPPPLSRRLEPGRYELVLQGLRLDDGSRSRKATVAFTVLR